MTRRNQAFVVLLCGILLICGNCSRLSQLRKSDNWRMKYKAAVAYYADKDYARASILFEAILPLVRGLAEEETTLFYYAYSQFYQKKYLISAHYFGLFIEAYGRSEWADEAYYRQIHSLYLSSPMYLYDQSATYDALEKAQGFLDERPYNPYRDKTQKMVDELQMRLEKKAFQIAYRYFHMRYYRAAKFALDNFRLYFPASPFVEKCMHLRVRAQYEWAKRAIKTKAPHYYRKTLDLYMEFIENYPHSQYQKTLTNVYEASVKALTEKETLSSQ